MRTSLDPEANQAELKCFEETALAAEGLLIHLLHHVNAFPSPAGVDQMMSNCTELSNGDDTERLSDVRRPADAGASSLSFVFMDSIVFTVVGRIDSPCARLIARDMAGLFTWEVAPGLPSMVAALQHPRASISQAKETTVEAPITSITEVRESPEDQFRLHHGDASVRVEMKPILQEGSKGVWLCQICGGEKTPVQATSTRLDLLQVPWKREQAILSNNTSTSRGHYVFHEDSEGSKTNGDSKKNPGPPRSVEVEKMPMSGGGNKDERQERLERVAKLHMERNNVAAVATPPPPPVPEPRKCECQCRAPQKPVRVCDLFEMDDCEPNIGSLDEERCLLDIVLDGVPLVFRDCGGDTTDKTLLGGRYTMNKFNLMEMTQDKHPLITDAAETPGFSFLQRLIHDEECYAQMKAFLINDSNAEAKELVEFCDAVKRYERALVPTDRLGQACAIYWEFMNPEGGRHLHFPPEICAHIQEAIQIANKAVKLGQNERWVPTRFAVPACHDSHRECIFRESGSARSLRGCA